MNFTLKILLFVFIYIIKTSNIFGQRSGEKLILSASVVSEGKPSVCERIDSTRYFILNLRLMNLNDTSISFWVMEDCWPLESFFILSDSIVFRSCFGGCAHPVPIKIELQPRQSVQFNATVKSYIKKPAVPIVKIGFRLFSSSDKLWNFGTSNKIKDDHDIIWSEAFELRDNLFTFKLD